MVDREYVIIYTAQIEKHVRGDAGLEAHIRSKMMHDDELKVERAFIGDNGVDNVRLTAQMFIVGDDDELEPVDETECEDCEIDADRMVIEHLMEASEHNELLNDKLAKSNTALKFTEDCSERSADNEDH